jgi:MFS family permease
MSSCIVGVAIGSVFGGDFVKHGRRSTIINFNIIGLVGSAMSIVMNFYVICAGRILLGFTCGVLLCATPKSLDEVIPNKLIDKGFGTSTNIMINVSFLICMILANFMPDEKPALMQNKFWMVLSTVQVPFQILAIILHSYIFTEETIEFNVKIGNKDEAI